MSSNFGHESFIRPSIANLSDANFFQELEAEANQLRNSQHSVHHSNINALPSIPSSRQKTEDSKPTIKKSRFAQQREAKLQTPKYQDNDLPVPTGRFKFDLDSDNADDSDLHQTNESRNTPKIPLISEITERYGETLDSSNNFLNSKFSPKEFLETNPSESASSNNPASDLSAHASIPPWELRRMANRNSSQKFPSNSSCQHDLHFEQPPSCSDAFRTSSTSKTFSSTEKQQVSSENESLLAQMSQDEILQEQAALKAHLMQSNPELLTKLLSKLNIKALPSDVTPSPETSSAAAPVVSKEEKHVRYADEDELIPCEPIPFQMEKSPFLSSQDSKVNSSAVQDSCDTHPLMFDWNGVRVMEKEGVHASVDHYPSDDGIHIHQTSAFTLKQLLRLILSSVPAQRIMGLKILNQIIARYIENPVHEIDEAEMTQLTQEFSNTALDILTVASQATRERNIGIATSALILVDTIFSKARMAQTSNSKQKCFFQSTWIEHLLTETTLLADFHSKFELQDLPRPSMTSIVRILRNMVALGESSKVSEEIVKRSSFLELIVQVLIAVSWPLDSKPRLEVLPDLAAFELLHAIAKSSRACSRSILDRGLLTPMLRFIALPYWDLIEASDQVTQISIQVPNEHIMGVLINSISFQFDLMTILAGYGLGTSLRTSLDPLLRTTTIGLQKILETSLSAIPSFVITQQFNLVASYLKLLQSWMRCAEDPHFSDPPHSINWSQVTEWESSILDFLRLSSTPSPRPAGISKVLARACDLIALYMEVSFRKKSNISSCLATLKSFVPRLQSVFEAAIRTLLQCCPQNKELKPDLTELYLLISLAKLKTCLNRISTKTENQPILASRDLEYDFSDDAFALACRLAFQYEEVSLLPWALSVLDLKCETKSKLDQVLLAGLFVRNSVGVIVNEILAETFQKCQPRIEYECRISKDNTIQENVSPKLSQLLPIFSDYTSYSGTSTQISEPSPRQIRDQVSQNDPAAFLLPSTWPLLAITCLKPEHLTSQISTIDIARASYALALVLQSSLNDIQTKFQSLSDIFPRFLLDRYSVWKSVMGSVIAINSQTYWPSCQDTSEKIWSSIFEDPVCSQLIMRLVKISPLYPTRPAKLPNQVDTDKAQKTETLKAQESEEAELYSTFTDILAIYDPSTSERNLTLMKILTPFLSMSRAREFRGILFNDYTHILKNMSQVRLEDLINLDSNSSNNDSIIEQYFYPIEDNAQILHKFAEFLTCYDDTILHSSTDDSFLFRYLIHHVSSQCWNEDLEEQIRIDLLKIILARKKEHKSDVNDEICQLVLSYDPPTRLSKIFSGPPRKKMQLEDLLDQEIIFKHPRSQWLEESFCQNNNTHDHQLYLHRLKDLGWITN